MANQSTSDHPSTTTVTPEYFTFRECFPNIVDCVKQELDKFCNDFIAKGYIAPGVCDYVRTVGIKDETKASKLVDTLLDRIKHDPSVYHSFINIIKRAGPWTDFLTQTMKECYEARCRLQAEALDEQKEKAFISSNDDKSIETTFPFLDISSLSEDMILDLEAKLRSDINNMKKKFAVFSVGIRKSLERRNVSLDDIKDCVLSLDGFTDDLGVKVLDPEDEKEIESAQTVAKIFMTLRKYISFFNYDIIEHIISLCGSPDDEKNLHDYLEEFKSFYQRNVFEVPPKAYSSSRPAAKKLKIKCTEQQLTLQRVKGIKDKVANILGLRYATLQLSSIKAGCVEIHFLISAAVADHIFPVSPAQLVAFRELGLKVVEIGSEPEDFQVQLRSQKEHQTGGIGELGGSTEECDELLNEIEWSTSSLRAEYTAKVAEEVLFIAPDITKEHPEVVSRKPSGPLSEAERAMLEEQGIRSNYHNSDLSIAKARYIIDKTVTVHPSECIGDSLTCEGVKDQIVTLMKSTNKNGVIIHYIGPGKKGAGDWCFYDGFISFREIMELYIQFFKGRVLSIISDCSYSGSWVREAMVFMDKQGVGPCGHAAKERGMLIKVFASCMASEIPSELTYFTHGATNYQDGVLFLENSFTKIKCDGSNNEQHMCHIDFTKGRCNNNIDQPCTMAPGSTWYQVQKKRVIRYDGIDPNHWRLTWCYLLLNDDDDLISQFQGITQGARDNAEKNENIDLKQYGQILKCGWGKEPPKEIKKWIEDNFYIDNQHEPSTHVQN